MIAQPALERRVSPDLARRLSPLLGEEELREQVVVEKEEVPHLAAVSCRGILCQIGMESCPLDLGNGESGPTHILTKRLIEAWPRLLAVGPRVFHKFLDAVCCSLAVGQPSHLPFSNPLRSFRYVVSGFWFIDPLGLPN
jgi:hypothetical protein